MRIISCQDWIPPVVVRSLKFIPPRAGSEAQGPIVIPALIQSIKNSRAEGIAGAGAAHNVVIGKLQRRLQDLYSLSRKQITAFGEVNDHEIFDSEPENR